MTQTLYFFFFLPRWRHRRDPTRLSQSRGEEVSADTRPRESRGPLAPAAGKCWCDEVRVAGTRSPRRHSHGGRVQEFSADASRAIPPRVEKSDALQSFYRPMPVLWVLFLLSSRKKKKVCFSPHVYLLSFKPNIDSEVITHCHQRWHDRRNVSQFKGVNFTRRCFIELLAVSKCRAAATVYKPTFASVR